MPVAELISKPYADKRRQLIEHGQAPDADRAGDPKLGKSDTVYLTVVDKDRNCVSLIQSNFIGFGSGLVPGDLGFALQNRGTLFALDEKHPNRLEPGKRPFHTIIPGAGDEGRQALAGLRRDGGRHAGAGTSAGAGQHDRLRHERPGSGRGAAGRARRLARPTGNAADPKAARYGRSWGCPDAVVSGLIKRGHKVERVRTNGGGYQAILLDPETGMLHGGSEDRKDGAAVGY